MDTLVLNEHRCRCGKLLLKGIVFDGILEIKCKHCGEKNKIGTIKMIEDKTRYLLMINNEGKIVTASSCITQALGYTCEEVVGKSFTQIDPTIPSELGKKLIGPESKLNEDNYFQIDSIHLTKDGKKIPVTVFLKLYKPTAEDPHVIATVELKHTTTEKTDDPEFSNNVCDFYFDLDKDGIGTYVSKSVETIFGLTQDTVIGKNYFDFLPIETRAEAQKTFKHFSALGQPYRVSHNIGSDASNKVVRNETYFTPKFNDNGKFCGYRVLGWVHKEL